MLEGSLDFDAALKQAREEPAQAAGRQCELYFYAAQNRLLDGDAAGARKLFEQAIALNVTEFNEHGMAQRELLALDNR
jgi:lipoprotein NlpI